MERKKWSLIYREKKEEEGLKKIKGIKALFQGKMSPVNTESCYNLLTIKCPEVVKERTHDTIKIPPC